MPSSTATPNPGGNTEEELRHAHDDMENYELRYHAKSLGLSVTTRTKHADLVGKLFDPPHLGTTCDVPHLNIGGNGQVHLEVPVGYQLP